MTEVTPPLAIEAVLTDRRLTALEEAVKHHREIAELERHHIWRAVTEVRQRKDQLADDLESLEEKTDKKFETISHLLWRSIGWGSATLGTTLLMVILKASKLL